MFRPVQLVPAAIALVVMLSGCSNQDNTAAPQFLDQEFADQIAQHVGIVLAAVNGGSMLSLTSTAATIRPAGAPVSQDAARPARDTLFASGNVAWVVVDTFFTAADTPQDDYDTLSTRASIHATGNGAIHSANFNSSFFHRADLSASGLSAVKDSIELAGTARDSSRSTFTGTFSNATVRLLIVSRITHSHVVTMKGQSLATPPLGALSDWMMQVTRYESGDTTRVQTQLNTEVIVAFDGTSKAVLNVGGLYEYQVDLDTGALTRYGAQRVAAR